MYLKKSANSKNHFKFASIYFTYTSVYILYLCRIKQYLLKTIIEEPSLNVKKHILQLIAVLVKHEILRGNWNELFALIDAYIQSNDINERVVSTYLN